MRRLVLIFGILLTLTAGVWTSALAAAATWCLHEAGSSDVAETDEHECCRARLGGTNEEHSASTPDSHEATHESSTRQEQSGATHAGMDCDGAAASAEEYGLAAKASVAFGERSQSCAECCVGRSGQMPTTAAVIASEQGKVKRDAGDDSPVDAGNLFAHATLDVSHLAPSQHAPPTPAGRRHILLNVFLV